MDDKKLIFMGPDKGPESVKVPERKNAKETNDPRQKQRDLAAEMAAALGGSAESALQETGEQTQKPENSSSHSQQRPPSLFDAMTASVAGDNRGVKSSTKSAEAERRREQADQSNVEGSVPWQQKWSTEYYRIPKADRRKMERRAATTYNEMRNAGKSHEEAAVVVSRIFNNPFITQTQLDGLKNMFDGANNDIADVAGNFERVEPNENRVAYNECYNAFRQSGMLNQWLLGQSASYTTPDGVQYKLVMGAERNTFSFYREKGKV